MPNANMKPKKIRATAKPSSEDESALQNKKVQYSLAGIAAIAACGAIGYALSKPSNRRRISQYADHASSFLPGYSRRTSLPERLGNQIADLVESALKR